MRIIAGTLKGKKLLAPEGSDTRPTADRAREALFNIITHNYLNHNFKQTTVLDIFAGSGALGLEALSRGALTASFVENNPKTISFLKQNIQNCRFENQSKVINQDAVKFNCSQKQFFSLIFLDPPYHKSLIIPTLNHLQTKKLLKKDALIIIETAKDEVLTLPDSYQEIEKRIYGITKFTFAVSNFTL